MAGYFNYVTLLECTISCCGPDSGLLLDVASYAMLLALYLALLMLLESITDNYFAASTKLIVRFMKLSPPVAGVTFLAVGNGASDVFSSIAAFSSGTPKTGVGTLLGAAFFVATVVVGVVALLSDGGVKLDRGAFLREVTFLLISACYLAWALADNDVTVGEICGFFGLYVSFVLVVVAQSLAAKRERAREEAAASLVGQPTKRETSQISLRDSDLEYGSNGAGYMSSGGSVAGTSHGRARGGPSRERSRSDLARSSSSLLGNDLDGFRPRSWSSDTVDLIAMRDEDGEARLPALTKGSYWTMSFLQAVGAPDAPRLSGAPASHAHHAGEHDARSSSATHSSVPGAVAGETEDSTHKSKHKKDASAPDEAAGHGMSQRAPLRYMRRVARRLLLPQLVSRVRLVLIRPVLAAIRFPFQIAWALTIPSLEEHRWNWRLAVVNPVCGSLLIGFTSFDSWMLASLLPSSYHAPWLRGWVVVASIGMIGSAWVGCTVPRARPPYPIRYIDSTEADSDSDSSGGNTDDDAPGGSHADQAPTADEFIVRRADKQRKYAGAGSCNEVALFVVLASLAFVAAVIHIVLIANEVVSIAATFGLILDMSPSMVGLSVCDHSMRSEPPRYARRVY